jgi:CMP-N-acetylneuraminic acid synthetase
MGPETIVGVIPARGGSKGVPGKNLRLLRGKPLIHYIITAALGSRSINAVYVSTDDEKIAEQARECGAKTILHAPELSEDAAPTFGVIRNSLLYLEQISAAPDIVATMRPTSPLCTSEDIDAAVDLLLLHPEASAVISVTPSPIHPYRILRITESGELIHYGYTTESGYPQRRQSFAPVYVRNGAVYASRAVTIRAGGLWGNHTLPYIMPPERSVNINQEVDFVLAEAIMARI